VTLYLPVGPPGCGKSTLCEWAIDNEVFTRDAVVSPDELRLWLTGDRTKQHRNRQVFEIAHLVAQIRLEEQQDVWFDATNIFTSEMADFAFLRDIPTVMILFDTPEDVLWERNGIRDHPVPDKVMQRMISRFNIWKSVNTEAYITPDQFRSTNAEVAARSAQSPR
jgi:predicted kinase